MSELKHYGILGMKWGVRRFRNEDGSLTEAGKKRQAAYDRKVRLYEYDKQETRDRANFLKSEAEREKSSRKLSAHYDSLANESDIDYDFKIAKVKAKSDPSYKYSKEYEEARQAKTQKTVDSVLYGEDGRKRISQYMAEGSSHGSAAARVATEDLLLSMADVLITSLIESSSRRNKK